MQAMALNQREINTPDGANVAALLAKKPQQKPKLEARFVHDLRDIHAAQLLRTRVFGAEYGVQFASENGVDCDAFDAHCEHLNVYDTANNKLIATTRMLTREKSLFTGGFYSSHEFDVAPLLKQLRGRVLEIGRTCVHPDYRSGAAITVLWSALADYLLSESFSYLIGCASLSLQDGGHNFSAIMPQLRDQHFVEASLRVMPRRGLTIDASRNTTPVSLPPLLKAYLRMGCKIGGEACWDPEFNCADVFVLLDVAALSARYAQRFLKAG